MFGLQDEVGGRGRGAGWVGVLEIRCVCVCVCVCVCPNRRFWCMGADGITAGIHQGGGWVWLRFPFHPLLFQFWSNGLQNDNTNDKAQDHTKPCHAMPAVPCLGLARLKTRPVLVSCVLLWWLTEWVAVQQPPPPPPCGGGTILGRWVFPESGWLGLVSPPPLR